METLLVVVFTAAFAGFITASLVMYKLLFSKKRSLI